MARTQEFRQLAVATPLGDDALLVNRFAGVERLGRCFEYDLDLISEDANISLNDVLGQNVTVRVQPSPQGDPRYFNGYVREFTVGRVLDGVTEYHAKMVPWLWFLTRTSDCRIFQDRTVPDIIKEVFRGHGFTNFEDRLTGGYRAWEYCVQYSETDFDFVSRLMEQEGLFYYFLHDNGKHTLVIANSSSTHDAVAGYEEVPYRPPTESLREQEYVREWQLTQRVQPGVYSHNDFDFKNPSKSLLTSAKVPRTHAAADFEVYHYPGEYDQASDGDFYARCRVQEQQIEFEVATGRGDVRGITTGRRFRFSEHPRADQCQEYLVTGTQIEVTSDRYESDGGAAGAMGEGNYQVDFTAVEVHQPFRAARITPRPMIRGPQTAIVVGPAGEEIYTDQYGRVKVMFHWDRYSQADENSSCWIRVAQHWAGKKWGTIFTPRIGQEVIVEFLEGDPDRPIITGRVYNGSTMPPYDLPGNATMSTIKSNSSKGGGGFNEIRFEDKAGSEQIFVHAQKNQDVRVKNDCFEWIGHNRHRIVKTDQFEHVENNRHEKIDADHMEEIGKDRHLKVSGKQAVEVTGSHSLKVSGDVIEQFQANHSEQVTKNYYLKGLALVIEGSTGITLKVGGSSVVIDNAGVTVKGTSVTLDGSTTKINSGPGSPASSGSAGSLVAPTAPTAAEEADTADPGAMAEAKARQRETKTGKYGAVPVKPFKPPEVPPQSQATQSWIEIELVDEDDQPVPGKRYRVVLPDESLAEGTLDDRGWARVEGFEKGPCKVSFPDLDQDAWETIDSTGPRAEG